MPRFYAVRFDREIPVIDGVVIHSAHDHYNLIEINDGIEYLHLEDYPHVEITEDEFNIRQFYAEGREYRSAYSDVEGLTPDPDELAKGKRKTKVYHTDESKALALSLKKKIMVRNVLDEYSVREDQSGKEELLAEIDALSNLQELFVWREEKLGIHMPFSVLKALGRLDENGNRLVPMIYGVQF